MQSEEWKAGLEAEKAGIKWWDNPHPSGSVASYEWDNGHTAARTRRARGGFLGPAASIKES